MKRMNLLLTLAIPVLLAQTSSAQTMSRLIGSATWTNNGATFMYSDSASYSYSGNRGGDLNHFLMYDNYTTYTWNDTAYLNSSLNVCTYDTLNNQTSSTDENWDTATASWVLEDKTLYFYTGSTLNNSIFQLYSSGWVNSSENVFTYSGGALTKMTTLAWNNLTSSWDPTSATTYAYDGSGNLTAQIDYSYSNVTMTYTETDQYNYTYNSANQMLTQVYATYNTGLLTTVPSYMYTNTYDTLGDMLTTLYQTYNASTAAYVNVSMKIFGNFISTNPQLEIDQNWDTIGGGSFDTVMEFVKSYNSFNQLTTSIGESWHAGGFWEFQPGNPEYNYYYQTVSTSGIKNVAENTGSVNVFPVPAQNVMNLNITWNEPQIATVAIYDMSGRIIRQWTTNQTAQYSSTVPVNNLAAGNYIISVTGNDGSAIQKQISIVH